jgi:hypothetical protein
MFSLSWTRKKQKKEIKIDVIKISFAARRQKENIP